MENYISIAHAAESEIEIKKSVFIGNSEIVKTKEEAEDFIASIRAKHPDARHICFAYLLRSGGISRISDDGEPQGTAGLPMLESIKKAGVCDVAVTVTRYFGGILLGAAGLCRAYTSACAEAIKLGGICEYAPFEKISVCCEYGDYPKIENATKKLGARVSAPVFENNVRFELFIESEKAERLISEITDISAARAKTEKLGEEMRQAQLA